MCHVPFSEQDTEEQLRVFLLSFRHCSRLHFSVTITQESRIMLSRLKFGDVKVGRAI